MENYDLSRRTLLKGGGTALAGLTVLRLAGPARAFAGQSGDEVIPWLDQYDESGSDLMLVENFRLR